MRFLFTTALLAITAPSLVVRPAHAAAQLPAFTRSPPQPKQISYPWERPFSEDKLDVARKFMLNTKWVDLLDHPNLNHHDHDHHHDDGHHHHDHDHNARANPFDTTTGAHKDSAQPEQHWCNVDKYMREFAPVSVEQPPQEKQAAQPMRIRVEFDEFASDDDVNPAVRDYVFAALDQSLNFVSSSFSLTPRSSITANHLPCGRAKLQQLSYTNTDFIVAVTLIQTSDEPNSVIASAGPCVLDGSGQPLAGSINVRPGGLIGTTAITDEIDRDFKFDVTILLHELFHALGFLPDVWNSYGATSVVNGRNVLSSAGVTAEYRNRLGCQDANTFPLLEDAGGAGTVGAHFDQRENVDEIMTGVILNTNVVSTLSLASFDDTPWFTVDLSKAEAYFFGANQGCSFHQASDCDAQFGVCSGFACDTQLREIRSCGFSSSAECTGHFFTSIRCDDPDIDSQFGDGETYGAGSRCFDSDFSRSARCHRSVCSADDNTGETTVFIEAGDFTTTQNITCVYDTTAGTPLAATAAVPGTSNSLTCPAELAVICPDLPLDVVPVANLDTCTGTCGFFGACEITDQGLACDCGAFNSGPSCDNSTIVCGDGLLTGPEECDDANTIDDDVCDNTCEFTVPATFVGTACAAAELRNVVSDIQYTFSPGVDAVEFIAANRALLSDVFQQQLSSLNLGNSVVTTSEIKASFTGETNAARVLTEVVMDTAAEADNLFAFYRGSSIFTVMAGNFASFGGPTVVEMRSYFEEVACACAANEAFETFNSNACVPDACVTLSPGCLNGGLCVNGGGTPRCDCSGTIDGEICASPSPSPSPSSSAAPTSTTSVTPSTSATPSSDASTSLSASPTSDASVTPSAAPTSDASVTPSTSAAPTSDASVTPSTSAAPTSGASVTPSTSAAPTSNESASPSTSPSATLGTLPTSDASETPSSSPSASPSPSPSISKEAVRNCVPVEGSGADQSWCDDNCNAKPVPFCPRTSCTCDGDEPDDDDDDENLVCIGVNPAAQLDDWCQQTCTHEPIICPDTLCTCGPRNETEPVADVLTCIAIAPQATNAFCNENCNQGFCPEDFCLCSTDGSTPENPDPLFVSKGTCAGVDDQWCSDVCAVSSIGQNCVFCCRPAS